VQALAQAQRRQPTQHGLPRRYLIEMHRLWIKFGRERDHLVARQPARAVLDPFYKGNSTLFTRAHLMGWALPLAAWCSFIVVLLVSAVVYMVSFVLLQALSRYREFAADRGSAIITGRPSALSSALLKISGQMDQIPRKDLRAASGELAAFYIFPPKVKDSVATLFSTHPSLEQRLAALSRLESQLQGASA